MKALAVYVLFSRFLAGSQKFADELTELLSEKLSQL